MKRITAILVDDEESSRDVLGSLLQRFCPEVELLTKCSHVTEAVQKIKELKPDLVFLDIEMPNYAGYEIVHFFDKVDFEIVFVTAYDNYALRAFEVAAVDYLLKPIDIQRLKGSVERVQKKLGTTNLNQNIEVLKQTLESKSIHNILVTDRGQQYVVKVDDIMAIEAQESYCLIHTASRKYLVSKNLRHFETVLETNSSFFRTHKSWIINRLHLQHYSRSEFSIQLSASLLAKLSKYRKEEFEKWLLAASVGE